MDYQMPVKAIKNILLKELDGFKQGFYDAYPSFIMADVMKEMVYIAHEELGNTLDTCTTYQDLEIYLSKAGYRMSLQEWINSL